MDLTNYTEKECEKLNLLTQFKSAHETNNWVAPKYNKELAMQATGKLELPENEASLLSLWNDLLKHEILEEKQDVQKYRAGIKKYYLLTEKGISIFRLGGFVKARKLAIERKERDWNVEQAAIEAPIIAKAANEIAKKALKWSMLAVFVSILLFLASVALQLYSSN